MEAQEILANIAFTTSGALVDLVDKKVIVILRDGRKLIGILRSYDQFANLVLQEAIERIFVGNRYGDVPKGTFIVRGENVVLMGEIDLDKEDNVSPSVASSIPESALPQLLEAHAAENVTKSQSEQHKAAMLRSLRGFSGEGAEGDSY
ncbi:U6 snRNA-associated Sm-like protein LSm1 [Malassezia restricta CBS 7877]|uniref:U6 snRNA-associated Sm-like protein LSm1 n=1 Tax=Malassezia restricta (strain ATCC 96810 / NBRC 103918 / CBS 7877) TaxID=425264 RepID=A0A3G2S8N3_MALR7|nr:U6 snRNA-associated Sm-like protein LSm1 [Malassezia restricta CBS 7877]